MKENREKNSIREDNRSKEHARFKVDKSQDTNLDGFIKVVPCRCRIFDSDTSIDENCTRSDFREICGKSQECQCFQEESREDNFLNALNTGNLELLKHYLEQNIDIIKTVDDEGNNALHIASDKGNMELLNFFLEKRIIDINAKNKKGITPLSSAIISSHSPAAKLLIKYGANPNISDKNGKSPLIYCTMKRNINIAFLLIKKGANVNAVDVFNNTALYLALVEYPYIDLAELLMSSGANPLIETNRLNPFLELVLNCTDSEKMRVIAVLIRRKIDINVIDPVSGRNCLHFNAIHGYLPLGRYLVKNGANLELMDRAQKLPHQVALEHNNKDLSDFFQKALLLRRVSVRSSLVKAMTENNPFFKNV